MAANSAIEAKVKGFEIGGRTFFTTLPSPWNSFGVEANYTYVDSENPGNTYTDIDGRLYDDAPIEGLSENNFNFTLMFEKGPVSLRAAYSWRDQYLMSTNSNGTNGDYTFWSAPGATGTDCNSQPDYCEIVDISLPVYSDDFAQVDVSGSYRFSDQFIVSLQVSNLTDAVPKTLQGGYPNDTLLPRSWFLYDRRAELVLNFNF